MRHRLSWMSDTRQPRRPPHANPRPGTLKCRSIASRLHPFENSSSPVTGNRATLAREIAGSAFGVICDVLEKNLPAERAIFRGAAHNPKLLGNQFNDRLRNFLATIVAAGRVRFKVSPGRGSVPVGHALLQILSSRSYGDRRPGRFPAVGLSHLEADELPNTGDP
jgi:hypothetical protein